MSRAHQFWDEQAEFSNATFGGTERGPLGPLKHLEKEAREAQEDAKTLDSRLNGPGEGILLTTEALRHNLHMEIVDCLFLTIDAARRSGMTLDELLDNAFRKLEINKKRTWGKPSTDGVVEHVRENVT